LWPPDYLIGCLSVTAPLLEQPLIGPKGWWGVFD
jgi:hypothetical protein